MTQYAKIKNLGFLPDYLTNRKWYEVIKQEQCGFYFTDDKGYKRFCLVIRSGDIGGGDWEIV